MNNNYDSDKNIKSRRTSSYQYNTKQQYNGASFQSRTNSQKHHPQPVDADKLKRKLDNSPKQKSRKNTQQNKPRQTNNNKTNWEIPEGSPIYTSHGVYYDDGRTPHTPKKQRNQNFYDTNHIEPKKRKKKPDSSKLIKARTYIRTFFCWFFLILILSLASFGFLYYKVFVKGTEYSSKVNYSVKFGEEYYSTESASKSYKNGVLCVDFTSLANTLNITSVGSIDSMRFIVPSENEDDSSGNGKEEYVIFNEGSRIASVNGTSVIMDGVSFSDGEHIWVPFSFVKNYISGIVAERNKKGNNVIISSANPKLSKDDSIVIPKISFLVAKSYPLDSIEYPN